MIAMGLELQFGEQVPGGEFEVCGHRSQDSAGQGAGFERAMIRGRHKVRSFHRGRQAVRVTAESTGMGFRIPVSEGKMGFLTARSEVAVIKSDVLVEITDAKLRKSLL